MKESKIIISTLPLIYAFMGYMFWVQQYHVMAAIMVILSVLFALLVIGIIANLKNH